MDTNDIKYARFLVALSDELQHTSVSLDDVAARLNCKFEDLREVFEEANDLLQKTGYGFVLDPHETKTQRFFRAVLNAETIAAILDRSVRKDTYVVICESAAEKADVPVEEMRAWVDKRQSTLPWYPDGNKDYFVLTQESIKDILKRLRELRTIARDPFTSDVLPNEGYEEGFLQATQKSMYQEKAPLREIEDELHRLNKLLAPSRRLKDYEVDQIAFYGKIPGK